MTIRKADYDKCEGQTFQVQIDDGHTVELKLKDVAEVERSPKGHESFTVLFDGPKEPFLEQKLYTVNNETLGELAIFLVPVAGDDTGIDYEAIYNVKLED